MAGNSATPGVPVAARLFAVLGAFDERNRALSLTELAGRAGLPKGTAHRLVGQLVEWGALTRVSSGRYVIGRRIWDLGTLAPMQSGLRQAASPFLHDLHAATRSTVHIAERSGNQVLYLERVFGDRVVSARVSAQAPPPAVSEIGTRLPMHATGVGKVLLAYAPAAVQDRVFASLTRVTPYTITQPGRLREQLRRVRREGYAYSQEEMNLGACSVAVPITTRQGRVVAALGLIVPRATMPAARPRLVAALKVAAQGIGRSILDWDPEPD